MTILELIARLWRMLCLRVNKNQYILTYNEETRLLTPSEGCVILRKENDWMLPDGVYLSEDDSVEDFNENENEN